MIDPVSDRTQDQADVPSWNRLFFVGVVVLIGVFVVSCVVRLYVLNRDANLITAYARDPGSVSPDSIRSLTDLESTVSLLHVIVIVAMYGVFFAWIAALNKRLRPLGHARWLRALPAWRVLWISVVAVFLLGLSTRQPPRGAPLGELVDADHRAMLFIGLRILIAVVYVWVALSIRRRSDTLLAQSSPG